MNVKYKFNNINNKYLLFIIYILNIICQNFKLALLQVYIYIFRGQILILKK